MKKRAYLTLMSLWVLLFIGCAKTEDCPQIGEDNRHLIKVAVSIPPMAYLVEKIAADDALVCSMMSSQQVPELAEPSFKKKAFFKQSDLYFKIGLAGFLFEDRYLDALHQSHSKLALVSLYDAVAPLLNTTEKDPHIWISIRHIPLFSEAIVKALIQLRPDRAAVYHDNAKKLLEMTQSVHQNIKDKLSIEDLLIISAHPSLYYLAKEYHLNAVTLEDQDKEMTLSKLQTIDSQIKQHNQSVLIVDEAHFSKIAHIISKRLKVPTIHWSPMEKDVLLNLNTLANEIAKQVVSPKQQS